MLNYDKYKEEIDKIFKEGKSLCEVNQTFIKAHCWGCSSDKEMRTNYQIKTLEWLTSEYKEPILTDKEKIIIKNILKAFEPFGKELSYITKDHWNCDESCFLNFKYGNDSFGTLTFNSGKLFKGMEINKRYTLRGLGL